MCHLWLLIIFLVSLANFLVNHGDGKFEDAITLIELVEQKVKDAFDIQLQREIIIVDKAYMQI